MTNTNLTELVFVVDRSGSMMSIKTDMEGGFAQLIADQLKLPDECRVTIAQFSDTYEVTHNAVALDSVLPFTLNPQGFTALLGAIGRTIDDVGARLAATPEDQRPSRVLFVVVTDGEENHSHAAAWSRPYADRETVLQRIRHQTEAYGWQFVYLGANQDAIAVGSALGITVNASFDATSKGTQNMLRSVSLSTAQYRSGGSYTIP